MQTAAVRVITYLACSPLVRQYSARVVSNHSGLEFLVQSTASDPAIGCAIETAKSGKMKISGQLGEAVAKNGKQTTQEFG